MATGTPRRYVEPGLVTRLGLNKVVALLSGLGIGMRGSRVLAIRGRQSGEWRTTPVYPLTHQGQRYLVSPRGETQWVRNLRAAGEGELRHGRHAERFTATELDDDAKPAILREYLSHWKLEVGMFFGGVGPDAPDTELRRIAPGYPVFRVTTRP